MASVFLAEALLPDGWAPNVRLVIENGLIAGVQPGAVAGPGDERHAVGIPGLPNLRSHAFSAAWPGCPRCAARRPTASGPGAR